jgi:hypothetical protein
VKSLLSGLKETGDPRADLAEMMHHLKPTNKNMQEMIIF